MPVPDPVGLAALIGLLNNVNFRDVTGLTANQANAAAALQQNVAAALEYGKEASKLAQQADLSRSKDQYFDALDKAKQKGAITDDQYKELTTARLKAMSTGATTNDSDAAKARLAVVQQAKDTGLLDAAAAKNAAAAIVTSPGQPTADAAASKINQIPAGTIKSVEVTQGDQSTRVDQQDLASLAAGGGGLAGTIQQMAAETILGAGTTAVPMTILPRWVDARTPGTRICCAIMEPLNPVVDPAAVGGHDYAPRFRHSDPVGFIYTEHAGFVDLGHVRDNADMTFWLFEQLSAGASVVSLYEGRADITIPPTSTTEARELAASIAYVESWAHELTTWGTTFQDRSSFSPEDLPSNMIGIEVAKRAIAAGGDYPKAVGSVLPAVLAELGARPTADTAAARENVRTTKAHGVRWYHFEAGLDVLGGLDRRNFDGDTWFAGMPFDAPQNFPWLNPGVFAAMYGHFDYAVRGTVDGRSGITLATMSTETNRLRAAWVAAHPGMDRP
jgi:hypothetical protein